jgi:hypothetical protein
VEQRRLAGVQEERVEGEPNRPQAEVNDWFDMVLLGAARMDP